MLNNENHIYSTPKASPIDNGIDIEKIKKQQKSLLATFLLYAAVTIVFRTVDDEYLAYAAIPLWPCLIAFVIFHARLCLLVFKKVTAILVSILALIPLLGFLVILFTSLYSSRIIKKHRNQISTNTDAQ